MTRLAPPLKASTADHFLSAVLGDEPVEQAHVIYPEPLEGTASVLVEALGRRGVVASVSLTPESAFRDPDIVQAANGWVPAPTDQAPQLLVLYGGQPWREPFPDDYRVGIQAMQHREAQLARGTRILFVDWPYGARKDAEVDLSPESVAEIFDRALAIDYGEMRRWNQDLLAILDGVEEVRVTCAYGTDVCFGVSRRRFLPENCRMSDAEPDVYLPGGEVYVAVQESTAHGTVAFRHVGAPRLATFEEGVLTSGTDEAGARDYALEEELGCGVEPLCEFGVGTNTWSPPWQIGTLYEKCAGTIHVAVGGNHHFGGERASPRHMDLVVRDPTVWLGARRLALPRADWRDSP